MIRWEARPKNRWSWRYWGWLQTHEIVDSDGNVIAEVFFGQYSKMIAKVPEILDGVNELIQEDPAMRKYAEEKGLV